MIKKILAGLLVVGMIASCGDGNPPKGQDNACSILKQRPGWWRDLQRTEKKWGTRPSVVMAIMWKESSFRAHARPRKEPKGSSGKGELRSSAYGFPQALDGTWDWYKKDTGQRGRKRSDFGDAADFIGWYTNESRKRSGISINDPYNQYLAYHQGHGGYNRGSYRSKSWLLGVARQVRNREAAYRSQLAYCRK